MIKRLIKCILLVSLFPSYFCGHVFSAKSVREVLLHEKNGKRVSVVRNCKLEKNVGKRVRGARSGFPRLPRRGCAPQKNKDFGVEEFLKKYWPYGLPILGVPPLGLLTYKLIDRSDTQSSVPGCLLSRNEFTPKQEGAWWCWLACLCGLLKAQNVRTPEGNEITQEWMYEKIFKKKPAKFYHSRNEGILNVSAAPCQWGEKFYVAVNNLIIPRQRRCYDATIQICFLYEEMERTSKTIAHIFKHFYDKVGKMPFMICSSMHRAHRVNVSRIYDGKNNEMIEIEDPMYGRRSTYKLNDYCKKYLSNPGVLNDPIDNVDKSNCTMIRMFSIAGQNCELKSYSLFCSDCDQIVDDRYYYSIHD